MNATLFRPLVLILGIALLFPACKDVEDPDPLPISKRLKSLQIVETGETMEFIYDQSNILTTVVQHYFDEQYEIHLTYNNNQLASMTFDFDGTTYPYQVRYSGDQMILSQVTEELHFKINGDDIESFTWYSPDSSGMQKSYEWQMDYENANAVGVTILEYTDGKPRDTSGLALSYLSSKSPFYFSPSVRAALLAAQGEGILLVFLLSQNNVESIQDSEGNSYSFQYTYTSEDQPSRIALSSSVFDLTMYLTYTD